MEPLKKHIKKEIEKIESDDRFQYDRANVLVNAPLALIQHGLDERRKALLEVLSKIEKLKK